jgi:hypothetical protein
LVVAGIVVVAVFIVAVVGANEGKVDFAAGGCCLCVEVNVREEEAASASADGRRLEASTVPVYVDAVVVNAEVVGFPVDEGISFSQPGFAEEKVVVFERVDEGIKSGGVLLS